MKNLKKLFLLGGLFLLTGTVANAELVNGVRQRPNVAKAEQFQVDVTYYLFNTKARLFFAGANDWNTRASVADHGYKVKFLVDQMETFPGSYEFRDSVETQKAWKSTFSTADGLAIWVDNANETYRFWEVVEQPNGAYRISNNYLVSSSDDGRANAEGKFLGWRGSDADTRLYFVDPAAEGAGVDWAFVTEETYNAWIEAWTSMKDQFNAAAGLLTWIKTAEEKSIDVSDEKALYANEDATVEALNAAVEAIQAKIKAAQAGSATLDNPADMTASLINPDFVNGKTGWNGTDPAFGEGAAEFYQKNYDINQTLTDMPNGVYGVSVQAFYRTSWANISYADWLNNVIIPAKVYAKSGEDSLNTALFSPWAFAQTGDLDELRAYGSWLNTVGVSEYDENGYIPNNMRATSYLFNSNPNNYKQTAYVAVDNGELTLGLKKNDSNPGGNWTMFDNFSLTYFGTAPEAYQMALEKGMPAKTVFSTVNVSKQYIDTYDEAYTLTASDKATFSAAVKAVANANDSIAKNIQLWADLQKKYDDAALKNVEFDYTVAALNLGDYLESGLGYDEEENEIELLPMGVKDYLEANAKEGDYDLSNETLETIIATLNTMMEAVDNEAKEGLQPGTDVTKFLTNPDFENGKNGWTVVSKGGGNVQLGGNNDNHCFEAWHSTNFDVYQEIENLPVGLYKLEVNGYVRYRDGNDAINNKQASYELFEAGVPIYVYMNDSKTNLINWFSYPKPTSFYNEIYGATYLYEDEENAYPDNMVAASAAFADGGYMQETICMVSEPNSIARIGVKGTPEAKFWPIFDNFKLTYLGAGSDVVKPQLEDMIAEAKTYENEMTTKTAKANLTSEINDAEALLAGEDGDAMLQAIDKLQKAIDDVKEGMTACQEFTGVVEDFMEFAQGIDSQTALQEGATILDNLNQSAYDPEDMEAKKLVLREIELKVQLPADYAQGSADGKDLTAFIKSADFSKYKEGLEVNAIEGWEGTSGYNFGNDDTQKGALALEFYNKTFDMYQYLTGVGEIVLPKGNYRLQVNAFERVSDDTPVYLYVETENGTYMKELMKHADGFNADEGEIGPGDMVSSVAMFEEGRYLNTIDFRSEGDYMRIGIKHEKTTGTDWIIMDNFKLYYFGDNVTVGGKLGDVNHDDAIDVTDAVLIIDDILMKNPANYDASLADVNGDSEIDVTDVVMVIDAILGKIELSRGAEPIDRSAYTAFQMDLTIPAGYVLESVSLTEIAKNSHSLAYAMMPDGRCRVVVCSMNNEALPGAWDEVISLNLRGKGDAQMTIDRAVFVTIDGERHELMMNPTSIAQISNLKPQTSNLYDLQGRRVEKNAKGVLIENGKKIFK